MTVSEKDNTRDIYANRLSCLTLLASAALLPAQTLHIYAIDVEGGKSTLYVSPSGESMLVDTGYGGTTTATRTA